jgi:hypothetical protein
VCVVTASTSHINSLASAEVGISSMDAINLAEPVADRLFSVGRIENGFAGNSDVEVIVSTLNDRHGRD